MIKVLDYINIQLEPWAFAPVRAHEWDAGVDLKTPISAAVVKGAPAVIDTGVHVEIPEGYCGLIKSKSGLNVMHGICTEGVIDAGYTGTIKVACYNTTDSPFIFRTGDKIAQLLIIPVETPDIRVVDRISGGERGDRGFGSTGR